MSCSWYAISSGTRRRRTRPWSPPRGPGWRPGNRQAARSRARLPRGRFWRLGIPAVAVAVAATIVAAVLVQGRAPALGARAAGVADPAAE